MAQAAVTGDHRRGKSALFFVACGAAGAAPHWLDPLRSLAPACTLALLLGGYGLRTVLRSRDQPCASGSEPLPEDAAIELPAVDVVVAARDEEAVVTRLVERLTALSYPRERLSLWVVDDGSEDRTGPLLDELKQQHPQLQVIHRKRGAGGGKSGALNTVLQQLKGDWMLVLDADAQLQNDVLERLLPFAIKGRWAAVQLRKAVTNAQEGWLTRVQAMEMALDALLQQGRLWGGGVMELRGNGQLLQRSRLQARVVSTRTP